MSEQDWQLEVGDTGKTRGGDSYRVICVDRKSPDGLPVIALVDEYFGEAGYAVNRAGETLNKLVSDRDLMPPDRVLAAA